MATFLLKRISLLIIRLNRISQVFPEFPWISMYFFEFFLSRHHLAKFVDAFYMSSNLNCANCVCCCLEKVGKAVENHRSFSTTSKQPQEGRLHCPSNWMALCLLFGQLDPWPTWSIMLVNTNRFSFSIESYRNFIA